VYADETSPGIRRWLHRRRHRRRAGAPADQVVSFAEYTRLYLESWTDPEIRWLMSTRTRRALGSGRPLARLDLPAA
jgi:hypothetical protein